MYVACVCVLYVSECVLCVACSVCVCVVHLCVCVCFVEREEYTVSGDECACGYWVCVREQERLFVYQ